MTWRVSWDGDVKSATKLHSAISDHETNGLYILVLVIGAGGLYTPPEGKDYTWYISGIYCQLGDCILPNYHLLQEPQKSIEKKLPTKFAN